MFMQDVIEEISAAAAAIGLDPAALLAVAEVESAGQAFATVDGRREPLIRFEGHYFDRRLSGDALARARALGLSSPAAAGTRPCAPAAALPSTAANMKQKTGRRCCDLQGSISSSASSKAPRASTTRSGSKWCSSALASGRGVFGFMARVPVGPGAHEAPGGGQGTVRRRAKRRRDRAKRGQRR